MSVARSTWAALVLMQTLKPLQLHETLNRNGRCAIGAQPGTSPNVDGRALVFGTDLGQLDRGRPRAAQPRFESHHSLERQLAGRHENPRSERSIAIKIGPDEYRTRLQS
jgi:hypothetical protein